MSHSFNLTSATTTSGSPHPDLVGKGFRPFFLMAALFAVGAVPAWVLMFGGRLDAAHYLGPTYWHAHEMVFGFASAVIADFLLTAVGNWTGRETAVGVPLALLAVLWILGRIAILLGHVLPGPVAAVVDLAFLPALAFCCARPLIATRSTRNYPLIWQHPLLWVLHVGHAFVALGLLLRAAAALSPLVPSSSALHALTAGGIGLATLGMMTRVGLGHTGRALAVPHSIGIAFGLVAGGAALRVIAGWLPVNAYVPSLLGAGLLWAAGFGVYAVVHAPLLLSPRVDGRPG